jgi:hypothetical protein
MLIKVRNERFNTESIAIVLDGMKTLEEIHYLEESLLNLLMYASDSNITHLPPLKEEICNILSLVKAMRPTGDDIQLIDREIPVINENN